MSTDAAIITQTQNEPDDIIDTSNSPPPKKARTSKDAMVTPERQTLENEKGPKKAYYAVLIEGHGGEVFSNDTQALASLSKHQNGTKSSFIKTRLKNEAVQLVKNHKKTVLNCILISKMLPATR